MRLAGWTTPERRPVFEHDGRQYLPRLEQLESVSRVFDGGWFAARLGWQYGKRDRSTDATRSAFVDALAARSVAFRSRGTFRPRLLDDASDGGTVEADDCLLSEQGLPVPSQSEASISFEASVCRVVLVVIKRCQSSAEREQSSRRSSEGEV